MNLANGSLISFAEDVARQHVLVGHPAHFTAGLTSANPNEGARETAKKLGSVHRIATEIGRVAYISMAPAPVAWRKTTRVVQKPSHLASEGSQYRLKRPAPSPGVAWTVGVGGANLVFRPYRKAHRVEIDRGAKGDGAMPPSGRPPAGGTIVKLPSQPYHEKRGSIRKVYELAFSSRFSGVAKRAAAPQRGFAPIKVAEESPALARRQEPAMAAYGRRMTRKETFLNGAMGPAFEMPLIEDETGPAALAVPGRGGSDFASSIGGAIEGFFARQARLPPTGMSGFDPRLSPAWAGLQLPG